MSSWFLKTINAGDDFLGHIGQASLTAQRPWVFWLGLVLLVPIGVFIHRRQARSLAGSPKALRSVLTAIRVTILLAMFVVLAGPYLKLDLSIDKKPIAAILVDRSASMNQPAGPFANDGEAARFAKAAGIPTRGDVLAPDTRKLLDLLTRAGLAREGLSSGASTFLAPLAKTHDLRLFAFDRELTLLALDPARPQVPEADAAQAGSSLLNEAILRVLDDAAGRSLGGIILLSDGRDTTGRPPSEAARAALAVGAPIFPVRVGSSSRGKDIAITDLFAPSQVAVGDTVDVTVTLQSPGFEGRSARVEMSTGDGPPIAKDVVLRGAEPQVVTLSFPATKAGTVALSVNVPPPADEPEALRANNADVAFVNVTDEKLRVLIVDGLPRWDLRFLKNTARRDHGLGGAKGSAEVDVRLMAESRGRAGGSGVPTTVDGLADYHVIVLGDVAAEDLGPAFFAALDIAVRDRGVGLIVEAGPLHAPQTWPQAAIDLLPVKLKAKSSGIEAPAYGPFRLEVSPEGTIHEAMRLFDDPARNANAWSQMPPYYWCAAADRAASGATVLAWNPTVQGRFGKLPLVAQHYAGKGKVLFLGTDSTWLWRRNVGERFFSKFWGQAIRAVARKEQADAKRSSLEVHPPRAQAGESIRVDLRAMTAAGVALGAPKVALRVIGPGGAMPLEVAAETTGQGRFAGTLAPTTPGDYRVAYEPGNGLPPVEARFRVHASSEELRNPSVDSAALDLLANTTGGRVVHADELAGLLKSIGGEAKRVEVHREASVWDNAFTLGLIVVLYSLDVGLRRLAGLS